MEKSKTERSPWVKSMKKPGPKKRKRKGFGEERKKKPRRKQQRLLVRPSTFVAFVLSFDFK